MRALVRFGLVLTSMLFATALLAATAGAATEARRPRP